MKIVLWIGNKAHQKALASKIHQLFPISGVVTETRENKKGFKFKALLDKTIEKVFLQSIGKSWSQLINYYNQLYNQFPKVASVDVENINSEKAYEFTKALNPDLIIVSGTRLVKSKMLSIKPTIGILNLHTGLSPYIKGGPNCTNWCIATKQYHLIGNTIMWIDEGIDSGNIVTTEFTNFDGNETLPELHIKVMEHAHALYLNAIEAIKNGDAPSISQHEIGKGKTYYTKEWNLKNKLNLVINFRKLKPYVQSKKMIEDRKKIRTVGL
jgi:methionyl-tRNA formyltransferase